MFGNIDLAHGAAEDAIDAVTVLDNFARQSVQVVGDRRLEQNPGEIGRRGYRRSLLPFETLTCSFKKTGQHDFTNPYS
jgi:hypothetical protein